MWCEGNMLYPGQILGSITLKPIEAPQLREYAEASGDFNSIHLDREVALKEGLPGIIAHGMLSAAFLAERARAVAPGYTLKNYKCRFKAMVALGDEVNVGGVVKEMSENRLTLDLTAKNQRGELVTTASVQLFKGPRS